MEYRPFPDERSDEFDAFMRYAFSPAEGPYDPEEADDHDTIADTRGLFDTDDDPVAVCAHHSFAAGSAAPTARSPGSPRSRPRRTSPAGDVVGRMLRESLTEYRDRGVFVSTLWPFEYLLRQLRLGDREPLSLPHRAPDQLGFVDDLIATAGDDAGSFRPLDEDDYAAVKPVIAAMADRYDLTMDWTEEVVARARALKGWKTDPFVYGWERDGGPPRDLRVQLRRRRGRRGRNGDARHRRRRR